MKTRLDLHSLAGDTTNLNHIKTVDGTNIDQVVSFMLFQSVTFCVVRISHFPKHDFAMNLVGLLPFC